jgi:hypothetical protein
MRRARQTLLPLLLAIGGGACTERMTAPGVCPNFCPGDSLQIEDVVLTNALGRDSAYAGYLQAHEAEALPVANLPGIVDSRAVFLMGKMFPQVVSGSDTAPITVDSSWVRVNIVRRDTKTANLWVKLYGLPIDLDSTKTFAQLAPAFSAAPLDSANIDSLRARPLIGDTATVRIWGDSIHSDSAGHVLLQVGADSTLALYFVLDTLRAPFVPGDSGQLAFGVRVAADSLASIALGAQEVFGRQASLRRFYHYTKMIDSTTDSTVYAAETRQTTFDSFVFDPPNAPLDSAAVYSTLVVGGAPAVRTLVRVTVPPFLRDTADVVRATLLLVPTAAVQGAAGDSFRVVATPVVTDLGPKSPLNANTSLWGGATVHIGSADTVRMELTDLVRAWARDTTAVTALVLGQEPEAATYTQIRFYSSRVPAFRPTLHVTYVRRFPFGAP